MISVVIPALNEEQPIAAVVHGCLTTGLAGEVIVVDNGSTDGTAERARAAGARVVSEPKPGYGRACAAGVAALSLPLSRDDVVVFLDGDGSDCPEFMPQLVEPIQRREQDFVIGSRTRGQRERGSMNFQQVFAGRVAGALLRLLYGVRYSDMCPFRAIRRDALENLGMKEQTYGWNLEMQMRAARARLRILEVPVNHRCRTGGESKVSGTLRGTFVAGMRIITTLFRVAFGHRLCNAQAMTRLRAIGNGFLTGLIAGLFMTVAMLVLAWLFGAATPLVIFGDRLSVFIPADTFLSLMGRVGGYNNMKQLGVGSVIAGQLLVGGLGGIVYGLVMRRHGRNRFAVSGAIFILLPLLVVGIFLWPILGTHYHGLPINRATAVTLSGLLVAFVVFERTIVLLFRFLSRARVEINDQEFSPSIGRRALIASGIAILAAGGGAELLRRLYRIATFSYDGTQYKGRIVQPITPNDLFYCVTKNVVDPKVNEHLWRLEVNGLVQTRQTYKLDRLKSLPAVEQETTLMCISNGLDAGLMSNAKWKGVPMKVLLAAASPLAGATKVRLHGVDNYTDTFPLEKAMDPTTLVVYEMNGETLPDRHGFPARVIVPGYFGEKHVKWITRIEVADESAIGFYEKQGWGPDFIVPTRSRFDEPDHESTFTSSIAANGIPVRGVAFGGDRGITRVEVSFDDGKTWQDAKLDYPGTKLTWALWSYAWRPAAAGDYTLVVRATDGESAVQEWDEERPFKSGTTGFHKIVVHVS